MNYFNPHLIQKAILTPEEGEAFKDGATLVEARDEVTGAVVRAWRKPEGHIYMETVLWPESVLRRISPTASTSHATEGEASQKLDPSAKVTPICPASPASTAQNSGNKQETS